MKGGAYKVVRETNQGGEVHYRTHLTSSPQPLAGAVFGKLTAFAETP